MSGSRMVFTNPEAIVTSGIRLNPTGLKQFFGEDAAERYKAALPKKAPSESPKSIIDSSD